MCPFQPVNCSLFIKKLSQFIKAVIQIMSLIIDQFLFYLVYQRFLKNCLYACTIKFLNKFEILTNSHFGFRKKHYTTHAVLDFLNKISNSKENSEHTLGIFLDLSKAFDTVDHGILLYKLSYHGIRGVSLEWFRSYLTDTSQYVSIGGSNSSSMTLSCGVHQGSILGPLLFLI